MNAAYTSGILRLENVDFVIDQMKRVLIQVKSRNSDLQRLREEVDLFDNETKPVTREIIENLKERQHSLAELVANDGLEAAKWSRQFLEIQTLHHTLQARRPLLYLKYILRRTEREELEIIWADLGEDIAEMVEEGLSPNTIRWTVAWQIIRTAGAYFWRAVVGVLTSVLPFLRFFKGS